MADLSLIRDDLLAFSQEIGVPLTSWQADALTLEARTTAIVAPRQSGKSRSLSVLALWWSFRSPGQRVLIVSAGEEASRRLLADVRRAATGSPLLSASVVDEQAGLLTLSNGSEIRSVPASERQVRGWTVDLLLVDEAAMVPDDLLLGAAFPTVAARPNARIVLASSATVASGAFFDHFRLGEQGSQHIASHRWILSDAHWISPSQIEAARESMSEARFSAEYEGVFASGADALFSRAALDRATADFLPVDLANLTGPARVLAGVDWGATTDRSALVAIGRIPSVEPCFVVCCAHRWPAGEPLHDVISDIAESPAHFDSLTMETNGLGYPCSHELAKRITQREAHRGGGQRQHRTVLVDETTLDEWRRGQDALRTESSSVVEESFHTRKLFVHTTAQIKAAAYASLRLLLDQQKLVLPAGATDLLRELLMLRVDLTQSGVEHIEAGSGHDDLADALMLSTGPHKDKRSGKFSTLLGRLADPRWRVPAPDRPVVSGDTVTTGGGVTIPRQGFQSVAGGELSQMPDIPAQPTISPSLARTRERVQASLTQKGTPSG